LSATEQRLTWRYLRRRCFAEGVSKAAVARMTQHASALSTERSYVISVLPRAVARELASGLTDRNRERSGIEGAVAIVVALAATVLGYARGRAALALRRRRGPSSSTAPDRSVPAADVHPLQRREEATSSLERR
jgi:Arc/MetJ family transcription regulator